MKTKKNAGGPPLSQTDYDDYMTGSGPKPASFKTAKPETIEDVHEHPEEAEEKELTNE